MGPIITLGKGRQKWQFWKGFSKNNNNSLLFSILEDIRVLNYSGKTNGWWEVRVQWTLSGVLHDEIAWFSRHRNTPGSLLSPKETLFHIFWKKRVFFKQSDRFWWNATSRQLCFFWRKFHFSCLGVRQVAKTCKFS